jgi:hypothetical protein
MDAVNYLTATNTNKNDILDPLSIIVKLFIYSHKPNGTKISIGNNRMYIQENTYIQGVLRKLNGDTKNDITILMCPVLYACVHYLKNKDNRKKYTPIFTIALDGLVKMKQTYSGTPIIYNIEHIINIIQMFLDRERNVIAEDSIVGPESKTLVNDSKGYSGSNVKKGTGKDTESKPLVNDSEPANHIPSATDSVINQDSPIFKIKEHIYQHLNDSWTEDRKNILFGYIKEISDVTNTNAPLKLLLIDGLTRFMDCMDAFVSNTLIHS